MPWHGSRSLLALALEKEQPWASILSCSAWAPSAAHSWQEGWASCSLSMGCCSAPLRWPFALCSCFTMQQTLRLDRMRNLMSTPEYDLAILGAGASGLIAADFAVQLGARTALLDKGPIGGDCTWTGCVPSKSLIKVASVAHDTRTAARYGIGVSTPITNMTEVRAYLRATIQQIYEPTMPEALRKKGMDVLIGAAQFLDPHTLEVGTEWIRAKKILINSRSEERR